MNPFKSLFQNPAIPRHLRGNFMHLYFDIAWFGVLSGSAINFLNVYAVRLGATATQIGLLTATGAIITLLLSMPAGRWLENQHTGRATFLTSVLFRVGYLAWIFLPWLFNPQGQIWALIIINLLASIPLTFLSLGFSALFAEAVPGEWRAHVSGTRNIVLSVMFMLTSLASGYILNHTSFPGGYQIIFAIGFIGAAMSSVHLYFIKPARELTASTAEQPAHPPEATLPQPAPGETIKNILRLDILKSPFRRVLLVMLAFHLAQYLAIPIFPLYMVNELRLDDNQIGIGTALFYFTVLLGSTQLSRVTRQFNHRTVSGLGAMGMSIYPILMALSGEAWHYYGLSIIGGFSWSLLGGAYLNYILEHIPGGDLPAHLAWYNMVANACILAGSILGPAIAGQTGLVGALILFGVLRGISGLAILKFG